MTSQEEGVQERVYQMCNDLGSAGVQAFMDITKVLHTPPLFYYCLLYVF